MQISCCPFFLFLCYFNVTRIKINITYNRSLCQALPSQPHHYRLCAGSPPSFRRYATTTEYTMVLVACTHQGLHVITTRLRKRHIFSELSFLSSIPTNREVNRSGATRLRTSNL
ncbi:hypothetical protein E2C01_080451 [Portunus trituberculatus]|uniref:Uncharacterized protein n=1 Tax=Portunus trituberculatus TaxID=210409 RepID=A0A5B7IYF8_PORTR|nr:hypothetical protein [Portunus trituberculatus]